ncbi:MAG TPA: hypothetical protein VHZ56_06265, partial [Devosia sp.]|nr:hypothetical protein [Devosia sp.]
MRMLSTSIAVLALVGGLAATAPGFAAPPNGQGQGQGQGQGGNSPIDCSLPANAQNPFCLQQQNGQNGGQGNHQFPNKGGNGNNQNGQGNNNQNGQGNSNDHNPPPPPPNGMGQGGGSFNFSSHDRNQFHQRFNGINFGFFGIPDFSIRLGVTIPHSYGL